MTAHRTALLRAGHSPSEFEEAKELGQIASVEGVIKFIPADIIAQRAMECGSYSRALFHWEQFMRDQNRDEMAEVTSHDELYQRLHSIYTHIDEPDGLDGITAHLNILSPDQQAFQHRRAGRWSAAQSWYEIELRKSPRDHDLQIELLGCLRESGQFGKVPRFLTRQFYAYFSPDQVLHYASFCSTHAQAANSSQKSGLLPFVTEACWATGQLDRLESALKECSSEDSTDFNTDVARILLSMQKNDKNTTSLRINQLRDAVSKTLTTAAASSLQSSHDVLLRLHIVHEIETLSGISRQPADGKQLVEMLASMDKRLAVIGSYIADKQYLLGIRRAVMTLSEYVLPPACRSRLLIASQHRLYKG